MARTGQEDKPAWSSVPLAVRAQVAHRLGARVRRAERAYGGYGPSGTFRLLLDDGRRAFFKGTYKLPEGSPVRWVLDREERVYERLGDLIHPWAPAYYGAFREGDWHALLLEDLGPDTVPPWTTSSARAAMRAYADFHARTYARPLPRWVPRARAWGSFGGSWQRLRALRGGLRSLASIAGPRAPEAERWLRRHVETLDSAAQRYSRTRGPYALLHLDTRSDNVRVHPTAAVPLRMFDWPFACAGPPELDFMAFAQSITCEGGPSPEALTAWYADVLPVRERVLADTAAAIAGFFGSRVWAPPPEGLPRIRQIQRRQFRASLAWAARLLDLPEPDWLEAVPS